MFHRLLHVESKMDYIALFSVISYFAYVDNTWFSIFKGQTIVIRPLDKNEF